MITQLHEWQSFYVLAGGASATLVGLMFVAISLGSGLYAPQHLPGLARSLTPTFIHFVYVLVTATVVLVPTITVTVLGGLLMLVGLASLGYTVSRLSLTCEAYRKGQIDKSDWVGTCSCRRSVTSCTATPASGCSRLACAGSTGRMLSPRWRRPASCCS